MLTEDEEFVYIPYKATKEQCSSYIAIKTFCQGLGLTGRLYVRHPKTDLASKASNPTFPRLIIHLEEYNLIVGVQDSKFVWIAIPTLSTEILCSMQREIVKSMFQKQGIDCSLKEVLRTVDEGTENANRILETMTEEEFKKALK